MSFDLQAWSESGGSTPSEAGTQGGVARVAVANPSPVVATPEAAPAQRRPRRVSIQRLLIRHGIAATRQRLEIARAIWEGAQHQCADDILAAVNARRGMHVSKATVYNTLNLLVEKRLLRELVVDPARVFYDRNTEPHHHFYDVDSGELTDIPAQSISIEGLPPLPAGVVTESVDIIVRTRRVGRG
jgi:Fur family iron response transcriptional regulator